MKNMVWMVASCSMVLLAARAYGAESDQTAKKEFYKALNARKFSEGSIFQRDSLLGLPYGPELAGSRKQHPVGQAVWHPWHDNDDACGCLQQDNVDTNGARCIVTEARYAGYFWNTFVEITIRQSEQTKNFIARFLDGSNLIVEKENLYANEQDKKDLDTWDGYDTQDANFRRGVTTARFKFRELLLADIQAGQEVIKRRRPTLLGWATIAGLPITMFCWWSKTQAAGK